MKTAAVAAMMLGSASAFHSKVNKVEGDIIKGDYIFTVSPTAQLDSCLSGVLSKGGLDKVDFIYDGDASFHGFSVHGMDEKDAAAIADLPEVEAVEEGQVMYAYGLQTNPTWGLDRVDQESATLDNLYYYKDSAGAGVDVYVIDTGVRITHNDFGSRASHGYTAFNSNNDGNGHGTHCASTAAGTTWGVAKNANVIGVKVLSDFGSGSTNGVVAGVNWANSQSSSRTKVGNMSLGGGASTAMDNAVNAGTDIVHVVASGNSNANACNFSPARAPARTPSTPCSRATPAPASPTLAPAPTSSLRAPASRLPGLLPTPPPTPSPVPRWLLLTLPALPRSSCPTPRP
jgi:subtilisin family serine protease